MENPEHSVEIPVIDCVDCLGRGWGIWFCDQEVSPERCGACKGEGFIEHNKEHARENASDIKYMERNGK